MILAEGSSALSFGRGWLQLDWQPGSSSVPASQKSFVMPQKPHLLQQTLRGHFWPGLAAFLPHSALPSQFDQQTSLGLMPLVPQYSSP
jgi:hypothetical protein